MTDKQEPLVLNVLNRDWTLRPITAKEQDNLYAKMLSCYPETDDKGEFTREQTPDEKALMVGYAQEAVELAGISYEDMPDKPAERILLGKKILETYAGLDKKKLYVYELPRGQS